MTAVDRPTGGPDAGGDSGAPYASLPPDRPAASVEEELLARWAEERLFEQTLAARAGAPEFVFFEGPPTANGRPGIHHVFARTIKDLFCRHRAMKGFHVTRKAGWDTHGLPVEIEVEKQLGISGKQDIERLGVERFNQLSRESVWRYRGDWEKLSARIGYWLDYANPYATYSNDYIESVWWALKTLHDRNLLYRGHKILPYCGRCGTALSSHEVALGYEGHEETEDPSLFVALDLVGDGGRGTGDEGPRDVPSGGSSPIPRPPSRRRILVWTTTPWTLVSNVALAVHPDFEYVELRKKSGAQWTVLLAESRAGAVLGEDYRDRWDEVARMRGTELAGMRYRRPLDWVPYTAGEHEIIVAEPFVSADEGTGVVHMAPAFGADDYAAGQRHGLAFLQPVNARGEFENVHALVDGKFVKAADDAIIEELKRRDVLWKAARLTHKYPHCWRCGTPLLYYARTSWFVRTTAYRDQMLARSARVNWQPPEVGENRFGDWLANNVDWAVSRDRYWGTPLPLWVCDASADHIESVGSYAELAKKTGEPLPQDFDPHKPYIDEYAWPCVKCDGTMRRVPAVIDAWFDSGSMPFAQWHFPFENRDVFERHYPADFIAEGLDQTRGWFYSLLAIATGLGDALPKNAGASQSAAASPSAAPYRAVVVNNLVLDAQGQKMSKSRGNTVDPWEVVGRHGADATRIFLLGTSQVWLPRRFDESQIRETAGRFLLTLKNLYNGIFATLANFGWAPSDDDPPVERRPALDRWVLSRLATVERKADEYLEQYDATDALRIIMEFVEEDVSKWYVRLARNAGRFYDVDGEDNRSAFATLHEVLMVSCRLLAPVAPFVTDWIHRELTGGRSVHLAPYVREERAPIDVGLEAAMDAVRRLATLGHAARQEVAIKTRQPLPRVVCVVPQTHERAVEALAGLVAAELNVKRVDFATSADELVTLEAKPSFRTLGKKFGKDTKIAAAAITALSGDALRAFERGEPLVISVGGVDHSLDTEDLAILRRASGSLVVKESAGYFVALDATVTAELRTEWIAREVVRAVQQARKDAGFAVSDRIILGVQGDAEVEEAVRTHRDWIAGEVLARELAIGEISHQPHAVQTTVDLDGLTVRIALTRIQ
ncbi:MAG TPA: isoleucine--tRNA ligase [Gemmatimonadaceae bacterium]|nr:isoleucine--tRNA ligase [Gemmatimonadaceae bacterium]